MAGLLCKAQLFLELKANDRGKGAALEVELPMDDIDSFQQHLKAIIAKEKEVPVENVLLQRMFYYSAKKPPIIISGTTDVCKAGTCSPVSLGVRFCKYTYFILQ